MTSELVLKESEPWQPHLQELHRQFFERAGDRCILWVNPAQGDPFSGEQFVDKRKVRVPIQHANFDVKLAPYLVPLDIGKSRDADVFKRSVAMAWEAWELDSLQEFNGQAIGGWAASDQPPQSLALHWATNCHIHSVNGLTKLLRFHDPSVREWLWPALTTKQQERLLGPANLVIALNRNQELMTHTSTAAFTNAIDDNPGKLLLTPAQWEQVNEYAVLHSAWLRCCSSRPAFRQVSATQSRWEGKILEALHAARAYGISDPQDRDLFATHAMLLGADFHEHEKMHPVWSKTRTGDYYGAACEEVSGRPVDHLQNYLHSI
jgi:hypothetical protein